jgi:hypothetical protein
VHDHPVQLTHSQLTTLASRWPSPEVLYLACEPVKSTDASTLTLGAFVPFVWYFPGTRELGLSVDAESGPDVNVDVDIGFPPFKNLTKSSVGVSDIRDENAVALFLSRLCPLGVEIEYGMTWHADLEKWVAELQDEENEMFANVLTPTNTNNTATNNNATDDTAITNPPSSKPSSSSLKPNYTSILTLQKVGGRRAGVTPC